MTKSFQPWIAELRLAGAVGVVMIHAGAFHILEYGQIPATQWWVAHLLTGSARWAVPVFIMLAGYLQLQKPVAELNASWLRSRLQRLGIPLIFWIVVFAVIKDGSLSIHRILTRLIWDQPYEHLFFLIVLLFLTLLTPILKRILVRLQPHQMLWLTVLSFLLMLVWIPHRFFLTFWLPYTAYYLAGYVLPKYLTQLSARFWAGLFLTSMVIIYLGTWLLVAQRIPNQDGFYLYSYFNPVVAISSISLLMLAVSQQKMTKLSSSLLKKLSQTTYGIYLIHPLLIIFWSQLIQVTGSWQPLAIGGLTLVSSYLLIRIWQRVPLLKLTI